MIEQTILPMTIRQPEHDLASLKSKFINYKLNVRAAMTAFFLDVGGFDIEYVLSILGVCGVIGFERNHARYLQLVGVLI